MTIAGSYLNVPARVIANDQRYLPTRQRVWVLEAIDVRSNTAFEIIVTHPSDVDPKAVVASPLPGTRIVSIASPPPTPSDALERSGPNSVLQIDLVINEDNLVTAFSVQGRFPVVGGKPTGTKVDAPPAPGKKRKRAPRK